MTTTSTLHAGSVLLLLCLVVAVGSAVPFNVTSRWCGNNPAGSCTGSTYSNIFEQQFAGGRYMFVTSLFPHKVSRYDTVGDTFNAGYIGSGSASNVEGVGSAASVHYPLGLAASSYEPVLLIGRACGISRVNLNTAELSFHAGHASQWGHVNGQAHNARFEYTLTGLALTPTRTPALEQLIVLDRLNHVVRQVDVGANIFSPPSSRYVATVAGSPGATGSQDGLGSVARFNFPTLIRTAGEYAYIFESGNQKVRKMNISIITGASGSSYVWTVFTPGFEAAIEVSNDGSTIWFASDTAVYSYNVAASASVLVAGAAGVTGFADGVGTTARFTKLWSMRRFKKSNSAETLVLGANGQLRELTLS